MHLVLTAAEWIETTGISTSIRESVWTYPIIQSTHVLGLGLFLGLTMMMDLRLMGRAMTTSHVADVMRRLLPWIHWGFALMSVTGALLTIATPVTFYSNPFFRAKLVFLALAGLNIWLFHATLFQTVRQWGHASRPPLRARLAGAASITLWSAIVVVGRLIAYNWFR